MVLPLAYAAAGDGGGFIFYTRNDDTVAVFTSTANRDTYFTTNSAELASIEGSQFAVGIGPTDGSTTGLTQAFVRRNNAWAEIPTQLIGARGQEGPQGPAGPGVDFTGIDDGVFLTNQSGALAPSSLTEETTVVESTKTIQAPDQNSYMLGNWTLDNGGSVIQITEQASNNIFYPIASRLATAGSIRPDFIRFAGVTDTPSPVTDAETFSGTTFQTQFTNQNTGIATRYTFRASPASDVTGCNLQIRLGSHTNDPPVFDWSRATGGGSFTISSSGDSVLDLPTPVFFEAGVEIFATVTGDGSTDLQIQGQTVGGIEVPYLVTRGRLATREPILSESTEALEYIQDTIATMFANGTQQGITVRYDDTDGTLDLTVTGTTPPIAPDPALSAFSIDIPSTVAVNTDLNVSHELRFTTQGTSQIQSLTLEVSPGTNVDLTVPASDGAHTQQVTLAGIDTSAAGTVTFQITGLTDTAEKIMSSTQTVTIRATQAHEQAYWGVSATNNPSTIGLGGLTGVDVTQPGTTFDIDTNLPSSQFLIILEPDDRQITSILERTFNVESLSRFTLGTNVRTIGSVQYNAYVLENNGPTGDVSFRVTHG